MTGTHTGHMHEAVLYRSDAELLDRAIPFLEDGLAADEPSLVATAQSTAARIRSALPEAPLHYLPVAEHGDNPVIALRRLMETLQAHADAGAGRVRIIGEPPYPRRPVETRDTAAWGWWARREAAINHALDGFPAWTVCAYDLRHAPTYVIDDVLATHPYLAGVGESRYNPRYRPPAEFLDQQAPSAPDALESGPPQVELVDPTPAGARRASRDLGAHLDRDQIEEFVYGISEAVTNARWHGVPPVGLRLWAGPDRVAGAVTDQGAGPTNPYVGLLPDPSSLHGGLGLWTVLQMCVNVGLDRTGPGFTLRLTSG